MNSEKKMVPSDPKFRFETRGLGSQPLRSFKGCPCRRRKSSWRRRTSTWTWEAPVFEAAYGLDSDQLWSINLVQRVCHVSPYSIYLKKKDMVQQHVPKSILLFCFNCNLFFAIHPLISICPFNKMITWLHWVPMQPLAQATVLQGRE